MTDYPSTLPCPLTADYKGAIDFGLSSVKFNRGNTRRRRLAARRLETYDLTFAFTTKQLWEFQSWANQFGYDWHEMPIVTHFSGFVAHEGPLPHRVRLTSDISATAMNDGVFKVKVSIELDALSRPLDVVVPTFRWIIANTPGAPSTPDWIIAKTPPSPSTDMIAAGTPHTPAA